ncbi:Phosphatidylethanolamine-binding protein [Tolypocladium paradoxum]|uniref:Phosphatidylethanolamine-binding protein n=1 Tax=Tolypocladium paradoxum TaxID=94208 RepID=A0A2S4KXP1_9HYPO|nr:Phosphatidylethanolamine-binding protein [Tolypocladium paradoxum]
MLVGPDAPPPHDPKFALWRHWVLPGLHPPQGVHGVVAQTKPALTEATEDLGPGPRDGHVVIPGSLPGILSLSSQHCRLRENRLNMSLSRNTHTDKPSSKPHRHIFLLFREPAAMALRSPDAAASVAKNKLRPVGVNWMLGAGDGREE